MFVRRLQEDIWRGQGFRMLEKDIQVVVVKI